jgi:hypothetical protein
MTLRLVEHRGRLVLREVGAHVWRAHDRHVARRNRLRHRSAVREVYRMMKEAASVPVERDLIGSKGHWIEKDGPPAGDGRQLYRIYDPNESSFLSALLTAVCRQSLETAPGFLVRASNFSGSGSGKGLLVKAMCMIASGVRPSAFTSGHDADEMDKRLTSALIEARPAVFLDNFNAKELKSNTLASALTENPAMVRPMGQTKNVPLHTRTFIAITGNAVEIAEDMARRLITTNLDAKMEDPERRPFKPGFLDDVLEARAELLSDALTIWRWGRQTVLKPGKALGSFEVWAQWCRDPLLMLGARDPVDRIDEIKAADPHRRALIEIFDTWWTIHRDILLKSTDLDPAVMACIDARLASWRAAR